jgi:hypothetical protein
MVVCHVKSLRTPGLDFVSLKIMIELFDFSLNTLCIYCEWRFAEEQGMAEFLSCNRLAELWMTIEQLHLSYLQTDESLHKIEQRNKLEGNPTCSIGSTYHCNKWKLIYKFVLLQYSNVWNIVFLCTIFYW